MKPPTPRLPERGCKANAPQMAASSVVPSWPARKMLEMLIDVCRKYVAMSGADKTTAALSFWTHDSATMPPPPFGVGTGDPSAGGTAT